jgi:outer membrane lipoprotein-sorting protein
MAILAIFGFVAVTTAMAEPSGADIMTSVYERPQGKDTSGLLKMTLVDSKGKERVRTIKQILGTFGPIDKKLMVFQSPADVRGTSFMNWSYAEAGRNDDQWIYLPALKRVKRISSEGRGDYFMGSDFTYDDLGDRHPTADTHKLIGTETVDGNVCWVIENTPKNPADLYSKTVTWVSQEKTVGVKRDYYDKRGTLQKTLRVSSIEKISGIWVIMVTEMKNIQKGTSTRMEFSEVKINTGIAESAFSENAMTKGL